MLIIIKLMCLFLGVWWSIVNFAKICIKDKIPAGNFLLQTIGIVGFIIIQFKLFQ